MDKGFTNVTTLLLEFIGRGLWRSLSCCEVLYELALLSEGLASSFSQAENHKYYPPTETPWVQNYFLSAKPKFLAPVNQYFEHMGSLKSLCRCCGDVGFLIIRLHCHNQSHPIPFMQTKYCLLIQQLSGSSFDPSLLDTIEIENWLQKRAGDRARQNEKYKCSGHWGTKWVIPCIYTRLMIFLWMSNDKSHK